MNSHRVQHPLKCVDESDIKNLQGKNYVKVKISHDKIEVEGVEAVIMSPLPSHLG